MSGKNPETESLEKQLGEFIALSGEYLKLVSHSKQIEKEAFFRMLFRLLPMLYVSGLALPETENPDDGGSERFVTEEEWENVFNTIRDKTGSDDALWFHDFEFNIPELQKGSFAEMLADIYQDLQDFTSLISKGTTSAVKNAVYDIKQLFLTHWGPRLLYLQSELHSRYYKAGENGIYDID